MRLKCLIVDDEPLAHNIILKYCADIDYLSVENQAYGPTEALSFITKEDYDIIFLDIKMPKMTGLEWLTLSKPQSQIIITSAYGEFALESYELNVCDYLLKPFGFSRFLKATEKAKEQIMLLPSSAQKDQTVLIKVDKTYYQVNPDDITYLESYGNYVKVHLRNKKLVTLRTMASLIHELDRPEFIQIHKSYYLNKNHLHSIEGNVISLTTQQQLPLSRQYKSNLMSRL